VNLVRVGGEVVVLPDQIWNGGDGMFPDQLISRKGEVLLVKEVCLRSIIVRHHDVAEDQGFYLNHSEYRVKSDNIR